MMHLRHAGVALVKLEFVQTSLRLRNNMSDE